MMIIISIIIITLENVVKTNPLPPFSNLKEAHVYLDVIVPPVLKCFQDTDPKVRFHACEALYNIAKVVRERGGILRYFCPGIFDALCKVSADPDNAVRNASSLLDRLMKDIVTEDDEGNALASGPVSSSLTTHGGARVAFSLEGGSNVADGDHLFNMEKFIKMVRARIHTGNPYVRQFLIGWLVVLDSVPDFNLIEYLPEFLAGVFKMLGDGQREIVQQANAALSEFLIEIQQTASILPHHHLTRILINCLRDTGTFKSSVTMHSSVLIIKTVLEWLTVFLEKLSQQEMLQYSSQILDAVLGTVGHKQESIRSASNSTNEALQNLIAKSDVSSLRSEMSRIVDVIAHRGLSPTHVNDIACRVCSLKWLMILIEKDSEGMMGYGVDKLFELLLKCLSDPSDHVVALSLQVLALISATEQQNFTRFLTLLLRMFRQDSQLIQKCGFIIRQLSIMLNPEKIYREIAQLLEHNSTLFHDVKRRADVDDRTASRDHQFTSNLVQILNITLLTSKELRELRNVIRDEKSKKGTNDLLCALYKCWSHNPVSTLELCLLAKAYKHASLLVQCLSEAEVTVHFLVQIDNLVQLIESPVFVDLRMALLEPHKHPYLLKTLYGVLMLLPVQSSAHEKLNKRLQCVQTLSVLSYMEIKNGGSDNDSHRDDKGMEGFLEHFKKVQESQTLSL